MENAREKIIVVASDASARARFAAALEASGYAASAFATAQESTEALHRDGADVLILDVGAAGAGDPAARDLVAAVRGSKTTDTVRVILIVRDGAAERAAALNLGADDAISQPVDESELVARVRALLRIRREEGHMLDKVRIAEEGQQIAHTAFEALAVTEKMASDATSLDHRLRIGLAAIVGVAIVMGGIYFLFARTAQKQTQRINLSIARLEGGLVHQQDLVAQARKLRESLAANGLDAAGDATNKEELQKHAADLKAQMSTANDEQLAQLQKELDETNQRVKRVEQGGSAPQEIIRSEEPSVCLLHVAVEFRSVQTGETLHYGGLNSQGEPIQDSDGKPVLTLGGSGPKVTLDAFGTGFIVGAGGQVLTNRHVAEPWWKNDELNDLEGQGLQAGIASIRAYFPGDPRAFPVEIGQISKDADLAIMQADLKDLHRPIVPLDPGKDGAVSGGSMVVMGYATGLAAILARTDEDTAQKILTAGSGDVSQVLAELARRDLIRPVITQGHVGDVLPDKIVFDAQTTHGGSGGPLFNAQGKVIGVTVAVLEGFGGSNFGVPIRFAEPLLAPAAHPSN
jgi:DNA-binding response OmpR family regulator/S1-C subfamily serine protease